MRPTLNPELFPETVRILRTIEPLRVTPEMHVFTRNDGRTDRAEGVLDWIGKPRLRQRRLRYGSAFGMTAAPVGRGGAPVFRRFAARSIPSLLRYAAHGTRKIDELLGRLPRVS